MKMFLDARQLFFKYRFGVEKNCKTRKLFYKLKGYSTDYLLKGLIRKKHQILKKKDYLEARMV